MHEGDIHISAVQVEADFREYIDYPVNAQGIGHRSAGVMDRYPVQGYRGLVGAG